MFVNLKHPLSKGDHVGGTLVFERAGKVNVEYSVESLGAQKGRRTWGSCITRTGTDANVRYWQKEHLILHRICPLSEVKQHNFSHCKCPRILVCAFGRTFNCALEAVAERMSAIDAVDGSHRHVSAVTVAVDATSV